MQGDVRKEYSFVHGGQSNFLQGETIQLPVWFIVFVNYSVISVLRVQNIFNVFVD
jgi:hypothetical protein